MIPREGAIQGLVMSQWLSGSRQFSSPPQLFTLLPAHPEVAETWGQSLVSVPHPGNKDIVTAAPWIDPVRVRLICLPQPGCFPSPAWYHTF